MIGTIYWLIDLAADKFEFINNWSFHVNINHIKSMNMHGFTVA